MGKKDHRVKFLSRNDEGLNEIRETYRVLSPEGRREGVEFFRYLKRFELRLEEKIRQERGTRPHKDDRG